MNVPAQPVTFYVPQSAADPIEIDVSHTGLRMVLVHREAIRRLGEQWKVLGLYFLLGPDPNSPDRFWAYVGEVGKRTLALRVAEHAVGKPWWNRALLVASASQNGFNSAEIGWLEGRFYDVLNNAVAATVKNQARPGDDSIALKDRAVLERYVEPTIAALRAVGAPPDTIDQLSAQAPTKKAHYHGTLADLIAEGMLKPGTHLQPTRGPKERTAVVLADGKLQVDGEQFESPSPAAQAVTGNKAEAGWDFWGAPSGDGTFVRIHELRLRLQKPAVSAQQPAKTFVTLGPPKPGKAHSPKKQHYGVSIADLIEGGFLTSGSVLNPVRTGLVDTEAVVLPNGQIEVAGQTFSNPTRAAIAVSKNKAEPGWDFWTTLVGGKRMSLHELRLELLQERQGAT